MTQAFDLWAEKIERLYRALAALAVRGEALGVPSPQGGEWFDHLERKVVPQLSLPPYLVVGIVGGTNTGKSVLFNQLAGEPASQVTTWAAGTRHPVALVPPGGIDEVQLARLFPGFTLCRWEQEEDPLSPRDESLLFWRVGEHMPAGIILLDTPDIDSDAEVHWQRADAIRQAADVLVAVLTPQKYNDAAVKKFFRQAAAGEKSVVVILNQADLVLDDPSQSPWLDTFCRETGLSPYRVYLIPRDRAAAAERALPLLRPLSTPAAAVAFAPPGACPPKALRASTLGGPPAPHIAAPLSIATPAPAQPAAATTAVDRQASLIADLAGLDVRAIKCRTIRAALNQALGQRGGVAKYLEQLRRHAGEFRTAAAALSVDQLVRTSWPALPTEVVEGELVAWWDARRGTLRRIGYGFYRSAGRAIAWPLSIVGNWIWPQPVEHSSQHEHRERQALAAALDRTFRELDARLAKAEPPVRRELAELLDGDRRRRLIDDALRELAALPAAGRPYREYVQRELGTYGERQRTWLFVIDLVDRAGFALRIALSLALVLAGWYLGQSSGWIGQVLLAALFLTLGELVAYALGRAATRGLARSLPRLHQRLRDDRLAWLKSWIDEHLLGPPARRLEQRASLVDSAEFHAVEAAWQGARRGLVE